MSKAHKSKRFNYHLKDVLKVRTIRERQEQDTFREAEKKLAREQQKEKELIETQENFYSELLSCISSDKTTDMDDIKRRKAHLERLKEQVDAQIEVRKKAEKDRDTQRQTLLGIPGGCGEPGHRRRRADTGPQQQEAAGMHREKRTVRAPAHPIGGGQPGRHADCGGAGVLGAARDGIHGCNLLLADRTACRLEQPSSTRSSSSHRGAVISVYRDHANCARSTDMAPRPSRSPTAALHSRERNRPFNRSRSERY